MALIANNGMTFPQRLNARGFIEFTSDIRALVRYSIYQILGTPITGRFMESEFGSRIQELLFEPIDEILIALARVYTVEAIARWEPRVSLNDVAVTIDPDGGKATIYVSYVIVNRDIQESLAVSIPRLVKGGV